MSHEIQGIISETAEAKVEISTILNKTKLGANEKLTAEFSFDGKVKQWYYKETDVKVINKRASKGKISVDLLAMDGEGKLELYVDFWCNADKEQMLRVFATSGLYRPEKSVNYYEHSVMKAIKDTSSRYQPQSESNKNPPESKKPSNGSGGNGKAELNVGCGQQFL
jgi:hypothetical protein